MDINEAVGLQVKQLRKGHVMTQLQLAFEAGLNLEHIGQVERGGTSPSVKNVAKIVAGLGVPVAQLFALHEADADPWAHQPVDRTDTLSRPEAAGRGRAGAVGGPPDA